MLRILISFFVLLGPSHFLAAQTPTPDPPSTAATDPDNKHVKVTRFSIAPHDLLTLPKLANESVLVCLRGELLGRIPENGSSEGWCTGPGGAVANRGGVGYRIENAADSPAEFLQIELKDSYAIGQVRVPYSERDPLVLDPRAFQVVLENEHVRLLRMHLDPRQSTDELQFPMRLEIALQHEHTIRSDSFGKTADLHANYGDIAWEKVRLMTVTNSDEKPLDHLLLELKHPFCYPHRHGLYLGQGADLAMEPYLRKVTDALQKKWERESLRVVRQEEHGIVQGVFNIDRDGTVSEDDIRMRIIFGSEALVEASLNSVRKAAPFAPLPAIFAKPKLEFLFTFSMELPKDPQGCEED